MSVYLSEAGKLRVQQEIRLLYANRKQLELDMDALRELTPLWQPILQEDNLPSDFRYVALPFAGAKNLDYWAVQPQQIQPIGLRIDQAVDETKHPLVATEKVSNYLTQLREKYQENAVRILLRFLQNDSSLTGTVAAKSQVESVWLDVDSPPLIWKILARKIMVEQQDLTYRPTVTYVLYSYRGTSGQTLSDIARQLRVPEDRFRPYNSWLRTPALPFGPTYPVLVRLTKEEFLTVWPGGTQGDNLMASPANKVDLGFPVLVKSVVRADGLRAPATFYTINDQKGIQAQSCDSPITLAFYGGISPEEFLKYNDMTAKDVVRPGQIYYLEQKAKRAKIPYHIVQRNQSLRDVANVYGMRLSSLLRFNRIETTKRAGPGRVLWLRNKRPRSRAVEYQQLPPEPAPLLPLPEPTLASTDTAADTATTDLPKEVAPVQPVTSETELVVVESNPAVPEPVEVPGQSEPTKPVVVPLPDKQVVIETKPTAPVVVVSPKPATLPPSVVPEGKGKEPATTATIHTVKPGQTYYAISNLYGVTPGQLYAWNRLSEAIPLEIGQKLIVSAPRKSVPGRPTTVTILPGKSSKGIINKFVVEGPKPIVYHVVQPGQTVYRVALINKTTVANIVKWNNLSDYTIDVGQKLIVRNPQ